jgi:transposase
LDDYIAEDNPVRVVEAFAGELDSEALGFEGMTPAATGRPAYHPAVLLKIYIYGYLNRIASSRRHEREFQRNIELMWLAGRLAPHFKSIADFRRNSGAAIRRACRQFIVLCRDLKLFTQAVVAIDGSKLKAAHLPCRRPRRRPACACLDGAQPSRANLRKRVFRMVIQTIYPGLLHWRCKN